MDLFSWPLKLVGSEGQPEGLEGRPEGSEGHPAGAAGQPRGGRMDGWMYVWTEVLLILLELVYSQGRSPNTPQDFTTK